MGLSFKKNLSILFIVFSSTFIISCSGGGGGGGGSSNTSGTCKDGNSSSYCTTEFHNNYGLKNIKAYEAYDDGYTGSGVKVAVLDGGFDTGHADLDANFITGYDEEDDNNTPNADSHNSTMGGHGTHVAGIIAAEKNGTGMHGVAYDASIIPIKIFQDNGSSISNTTNGVAYGVDQGAIAINNSWGTSGWTGAASCGGTTCYGYIPYTQSSSGFDTTAEQDEWEDVKTSNSVAVFAAGNNGNNSETGKIKFYRSTSTSSGFVNSYTPQVVKNAGLISYVNRTTYEGRYGLDSDVSGNWLTVVAVDSNNTIASFSNGCGDAKAFCIAAPGSAIYSTVPTSLNSSGYDTYNGTSMAAPHVSGAIALLKQKWPNLTGAQLVNLLINNATDLGASGVDEVYGVGLLNLQGSMQASGALQISYIDDNGNLKKYSIDDTNISTNSLLNNLNTELPVGVVDEYDRVYSVRLNNISNPSEIKHDNFLNIRNLNNHNQYIDAIGGLYFSQHNQSKDYNENFRAKERIYDYDLLSYEKFIFDNQQKFYIPIGEMTSITSNTNDMQNFIIRSNYLYNRSSYDLNIEAGFIIEKDNLLGSKFSGAYKIDGTQTYYTKLKNSLNFNQNNQLKLNLGYGITQVKFEDTNAIRMSDIHTLDSVLAYEKTHKNSKLSLSYQIPLQISQGHVEFTNVSGYEQNGFYKNGTNQIDLAQDLSNGSLNFYYDIDLNQHSDFGVMYMIDNENLSKVQIVYNKAF